MVSPSINNPRIAPTRTDPPMIIGIDCVAFTPMPETQKLSISADPTAMPAIHDQNIPAESQARFDVPPSLSMITPSRIDPKIAATN
jgi:hypothetical protein